MCVEDVDRQSSACPPNKVGFAHHCVPRASLLISPLFPARVPHGLGTETEQLVRSSTIRNSQKVKRQMPIRECKDKHVWSVPPAGWNSAVESSEGLALVTTWLALETSVPSEKSHMQTTYLIILFI